MRNNLILLHSTMKKHMQSHAHLWKKIAIVTLLVTQATSFVFNGSSFSRSYPVKEVAKNECRKMKWEELTADCKEQLPVITNADYKAHENDPKYRLVYSIMWGGTYNDGWDMDKGGHEGIDIVSAEGTPIYAIEDGLVTKARAQAGYGNVVTIKHTLPNGKFVFSTYGHLSAITIPEGVQVKEGEMIGRMGHEGMAYGDHLHFVINTTQDNTYAFRDCPDLKKGEIAIGNQGLCRSYLVARTVDPIAWIESQGNGMNINGTLANSNTPASNTSTTPRRRMPMVALPPSTVQTPVTSALIQKVMPSADTSAKSTTTQKALSTRIVSAKDVSKNEIAFASVDSKKTASSNGTTIVMNNTSKLGEDFLAKYNVTMTPSFGNSMTVGQTSSLVITITDKATGKPFAGMLPKELTIIPSQALLTLSPQVIRLTNNEGKAIVLISADKAGSTDLIVSYNMKSVAKITINVN